MQNSIQEITPAEVKQKLDQNQDFVLLDVREDEEWAEGHLPNAIHIPRVQIPEEFEEQCSDKQKNIVAYCARGRRSLMAAETLVKMGYTNVQSMAGGIVSWHDQGLPIENS
jgi:rhodanese-related sulfurtransferase